MANFNGCEVNGIRLCSTNDFPELYRKCIEAAKALRNKAINEVTLRKDDNYHFGHRFDNAESVAYRAFGWMPTDATDSQINDYIMAAYLDSASADYWYTFEKDWGSDDE